MSRAVAVAVENYSLGHAEWGAPPVSILSDKSLDASIQGGECRQSLLSRHKMGKALCGECLMAKK